MSEKKPKEYLMELEVGGGLQITPDLANKFRTAASNLKMQGMKFTTKMITGGLIITRLK